MVDIVVTAANVQSGANSESVPGKAGAAVTAGQVVYRDPDTLKFLPADANAAGASARAAFGVALNSAGNNQPLFVQTKGDITIGAVLVPNTIYLLSDTAGGIKPAADQDPGDYPTIIGIAISASVLRLAMVSSPTVVA